MTVSEPEAPGLLETVEALLPQTQCQRCGFDGCAPYAAAVVSGEVPPDRCPPGGDWTVAAVSRVLGRTTASLDPAFREWVPSQVARIDEAACIGCTLCIAACPTDAIIGAARRMHGVLSRECTGCLLCLPVCPVDCIDMVSDDLTPGSPDAWLEVRAGRARSRFERRARRLAGSSRSRDRRPGVRRHAAGEPCTQPDFSREISAAVERVRRRRTDAKDAPSDGS